MPAEVQLFTWPDYVVFVLMFFVCIIIGIYFGFYQKSKNVSDYLVGSRSMSVFPVAVSLVVSYISGISFLGLPTEMYIFGMQYFYIVLSAFIMALVAHNVFLPIFLELELTSTYEYLERRFDGSMRRFGSIMFIIAVLLWLPIVVYVPALALNHATGIHVHIVTPIVCVICIFYTCVGGIRAVVWTDFLQAFVMVGSLILVIVKGTMDVGGLGVVLQRNLDTGRLEPPDFDLSPYKRNSIWGLIIGGGFSFIQGGIINQVMMQRYVSLPSLQAASRALWLFCVFKALFFLMCCYSGLLIYAKYYDCDPITTQVVKARDQLLPLLVIDSLGSVPGIPGLFLAGVFSASLSSLSSGLNSLAAVILEDCYKPMFGKISARHADMVVKTTVVVVGTIAVALAFIVERLGPVLQLSISLGSMASGPLLGVFIMGALLPHTNARGAFYGGFMALGIMLFINWNAQAAIAAGQIVHPTKAISTAGCDFNFTIPESAPQPDNLDEVFPLFRLSHLWYTTAGGFLTILFGLIISYFTGWNGDRKIDPVLVAPFLRKYLHEKNCAQEEYCMQYPKPNADEKPEAVDLIKKIKLEEL